MKRLRRWEKFTIFESRLPDNLLFKFESEDQGVFRLKFSNMGRYLAACCTMGSGRTIIKIFDIEKEEDHLIVVLSGHSDLIHDIDWSYKDKYLCTASSDCSCKVWELKNLTKNHSDALNYDTNKNIFYECVIPHPSFVYGSKFHPVRDEKNQFLATICFDGKVRIWRVDIPFEENVDAFYLLESKSILDSPNFTQPSANYEMEENLEEETLKLIMNPQDD